MWRKSNWLTGAEDMCGQWPFNMRRAKDAFLGMKNGKTRVQMI